MLDYRYIFFILGMLVAAPVLFYYYRRNPNPRFRPRLGEMLLLALLSVFLVGGFSYYVGGIMQDPDQLRLEERLTRPVLEQSSPIDLDDDRDRGRGGERQSSGGGARGGPPAPPAR